MKLNETQLEYLRDEWLIPIRLMRPLDAYRCWVRNSNSYGGVRSGYELTVILRDGDGDVQYTIPTNGKMPGEDSLPFQLA